MAIPVRVRPGTTTRPPVGDDDRALMIQESCVEDVRPSVLLVGESGTGKTEAIRSLLAAGKRVLVLDVEAKMQVLMRHNPMAIRIATPIEENGVKRRATPTDRYNRLMRFADMLARGQFREHNGQPIDVLATDGIMELADVFKRHHLDNTPRASSSGERNTFAAYDLIGTQTVDFIKTLREAASEASRVFGIPPIGIVATCGERFDGDKFGMGRYVPILPGRIAGNALPFLFEAILRLSVERDSDDYPIFTYYSVSSDQWFAKCPGGILPPKFGGRVGSDEIPTFNTVYDKLVEFYKSGTVPA